MLKNRKKKGFTLIELIVVIAILGILAAVLIPRFTGFQGKARGTQALTDAKQLATAMDSLEAEKGKGSYTEDEAKKLAFGTDTPKSTVTKCDPATGEVWVTYTIGSDNYVAGRSAYGVSVAVTQ